MANAMNGSSHFCTLWHQVEGGIVGRGVGIFAKTCKHWDEGVSC